jgi:hypothetical protein
MVNSITTKTAQPGDYVYMVTASPITVDGRIVVPVNSYMQGVVTHSQRAGKVQGKAQLAIRLQTLTLPQGGTLEFSPVLDSVDANNSGQKVDKSENLVRQGPDTEKDAARVAIRRYGATIGGLLTTVGKARNRCTSRWRSATVLLTRGREVGCASSSPTSSSIALQLQTLRVSPPGDRISASRSR